MYIYICINLYISGKRFGGFGFQGSWDPSPGTRISINTRNSMIWGS